MADENGDGVQDQESDDTGTDTTPWADPEAARKEIEKLRTEAATWRRKTRELEPLAKKAQEADEATKTEVQKLSERLAEAEQRALQAELAGLRHEIASRHGLTPAQAKRLQGATEAELEEDAKAFAKEIGASGTNGNGSKPKPDLKQGDRGNGAPSQDAEQWLRRLASR